MGIRREANAFCVFLCIVSPILNFLHSHDDRFAAQIVYRAILSAIALTTAEAPVRSVGGLLRRGVARLYTVYCFVSLPFISVLRVEIDLVR